MKKSLKETMMICAQNQQKTGARKNKVEFLALREDIADALEKGWSMTSIWKTLRDEGSFTATYNTFRLYVLKYLDGRIPNYFQKNFIEQQIKKATNDKDKEKKQSLIPSFTFNPIPDPKKLL